MDVILSALGKLLLKALPTFILVYLLHLFLRWAFYKPMEGVLHERWEATDGARKTARESLTRAEAKAAEYEAALAKARGELFKEQDQTRARLQQERAAALAEARQHTNAMIKQAKAELAAEAETARKKLEGESDALAEQIVVTLLERRAS